MTPGSRNTPLTPSEPSCMLSAMSIRAKRLGKGPSHWAAPWVLAMLCLRALVPAGFMLAPVDGRLAFVLCEADAAHNGHHHGGPDYPGHHQHLHLDRTCPYAQSAGPAPLPTLPAIGPQTVVSAPGLVVQVGRVYVPCGPPRQHSPRGPPYLA